jgi:cyclic pyranopterin phosphate synthase
MSKAESPRHQENSIFPDSKKKFESYWSANPFKMYSHIPKLYEWYLGNDIYPISIEIGLTSACNHNCRWCSVKPKNIQRHDFLSVELLDMLITDIQRMDVKSVVISGSGEQTLHPHFPLFIKGLKEIGIGIGINTNGSNLNDRLCEAIVDNSTWIRVSLDAATEDVRKSVHGLGDLHKAITGLKRLAALKREKGHTLSIGTQMVVCPENEEEIESCARLSASLGADYHQIKPVSPFRLYYPERKDGKNDMKRWLETVKTVVMQSSQNGNMIIVRYDQFTDFIENGQRRRSEANLPCLTTFSPYIEADGNVWYCVDKKGQEEFRLGNLKSDSLKDIWHSEKRKNVLSYLKTNHCNHICRNSPLNEFLWDMKNPSPFYDFL